MEGEDNLSSQSPGASLSQCELADQDVGIGDRLVAVIADVLFLRDDSHVVSLIFVGPRLPCPLISKLLASYLCRVNPAGPCRPSERAPQPPHLVF